MNIYFLFSIIILLSACAPAAQHIQEHPAYFDEVFAKADSIGHSDLPASHAYLQSAYAAFPEPGMIDLWRKYEHLFIYHIGKTYNFSLAMLYADSMLYTLRDRSLQQRYPVYYAGALFAKGDVLRDQQKYNEAYTYFYRGREILRKTNDTCEYHQYASRLALVYYRQEKYLEAAPYFLETFERLGQCDTSDYNTFYLRQGMLDNVALSYDKAGNTRQALAYYDSTLYFIRLQGAKFRHIPEYERGMQAAAAVVYGNKGSALLRMGDTLAAESLFLQSIAINIRGRDEKVDAQLTMAKLTALYLAANRLKDAAAVLQEMQAAQALAPNADCRQRWLHLRWQYFEKTGRTDSGYATLKAYTQLKDSLAAAATKPDIADIKEEFEHMSRVHQLEIIEKNNQLKTAYLGILVILFIIVLLIAWMIWQNWRKSHRHIAELQRLNQEITARHDDIRKSLTALEQSHQNNSRMMKIVAHDLRNPVGAIYSIAQLLQHGKLSPEKDQEMLELIKTSSDSALHLISDLLVLDTALTNMEKELVEIHVSLKYCVDLLQTKAMEKQQNIVLETEPVKVLASREKIWRVFSNLINNAIKFSPDGSRIEVALKRVNGTARISVKDQGIGIPPAMQDKIFSLSSEVKRRGTRGEESFGFGLSISKQIIEAHNGRIWFETEHGKGTTFYVEMSASA
ncbi:ATP-binding protein [Chitinophaga japonensis]|uniref:histidine kinase n=1 Tax=Chitinophaga japonensis TaxID=104662 RepID=A0A562ST35_CHIJA|nr:tetratricopeptide repeat-containing sensor histidine kinase [Chitinophaga japonensis]TWI84437.1 signal transduction histidine kinase [Chitinophaga japonensis]